MTLHAQAFLCCLHLHSGEDQKPFKANEEIKMDQAANLKGFCASMNPRFEGGILDFIHGIPDLMERIPDFMKILIYFNVVQRKIHWQKVEILNFNACGRLYFHNDYI